MLKLLSWLVPGGGVVAAGASVFSAVVTFFSTPFGRWVGIALIGAGLYLVGDVHRAVLDRAKYRAELTAAVKQADEARAARDAEIKQQITADAEQRIAAIARETEQLQSKVADYERTLSTANAGACRATDDDARRLRELWNAPEPAAGGSAGRVRGYFTRGRAAPGQGR